MCFTPLVTLVTLKLLFYTQHPFLFLFKKEPNAKENWETPCHIDNGAAAGWGEGNSEMSSSFPSGSRQQQHIAWCQAKPLLSIKVSSPHTLFHSFDGVFSPIKKRKKSVLFPPPALSITRLNSHNTNIYYMLLSFVGAYFLNRYWCVMTTIRELWLYCYNTTTVLHRCPCIHPIVNTLT